MRKEQGFTLIELIVVVALIMILASIGLGSFITSTIRSHDTQRRNDLFQIAKAVESYNSDIGSYPKADASGNMLCYEKVTDVNTGTVTVTYPACTGKLTMRIDGVSVSYLAIPTDPEPTNKYLYESDGKSYAIYTVIQNPNDKDLLKDTNGVVIANPYGKSCGAEDCNYKVTESGLSKTNVAN